ncbi:MAG TPA: hypothetical protein PK156_17795 [Polyangium sp.]|nr:hypothetical protein [Polyangium sp.]
MTDAHAKLVLRGAGLFNVLGGGSILALPEWSSGVLYGKTFGPTDDLLRTYHFLLFGFVVAIGIGLWNSANDPREGRGILIASVLGKTLAAVTWLRMVAAHQGTTMLAIASVADLAWAVVFVLVLRGLAAASKPA